MIRKLKNVASVVIKKHGLKPIKIQFKDVWRGRARYYTRSITIPLWIFSGVGAFQIYYIVHELTHFICMDKFKNREHGVLFKKIESRILKDYNILPIYSKAYAKELRNLKGEKMWGDKGKNEKTYPHC